MSGWTTNGMPVLEPGELTGDELLPLDTELAAGQSPQSAAITTASLGFGQATLAAAGASQGDAAQITAAVTMVTVTASTQGVKLPAATTGARYIVMAPTAKGVKVYPATGGTIGSGSTNAAVALVLNKANLYIAENTTHWRVLAGA